MLDLIQIREKLSDRNLKKVAIGAGLHFNSVYRAMKPKLDPRYSTVKALSDYLEEVK